MTVVMLVVMVAVTALAIVIATVQVLVESHPERPGVEEESVFTDLPEYDLRRLMIARDPLCALYAFLVNVKVVLPTLYGLRMCPDCPHCVETRCPCMDIFGSNGTPMGGSAGRADAMVGAVEAQKAEGTLHLHLFLYLQMAHQYMTLQEIAELFRKKLLSMEVLKNFVETVRCASYPFPEEFEAERADIEKGWPAYAKDQSLSRPPAFLSPAASKPSSPLLSSAWLAEGSKWRTEYLRRQQHIMSRMNHHIHPIVNFDTGERKPLKSCCKKGHPNICKGGFPLDSEITDHTLLVCLCIAQRMNLCTSGPRSLLSTILPKRNNAWQNAGPSAWLIFTGDNGDIKFPHRTPVIAETHEAVAIWDAKSSACCAGVSSLQLLYDGQAAQAVAAGYFGGYSAKMQDIGEKELKRLKESLERKVDNSKRKPLAEEFQVYSKRLLKDLEAKSVIRTAVESLNLSVHGDEQDVLMAECIRTFPTATFPASRLLKREEVETLKVAGRSIIAAVFHGKGQGRKTWSEAPFDLLYGFRGSKYEVDLLSAFEMLMHWYPERVLPPKRNDPNPTSMWTPAGDRYMKQCLANGDKPVWQAGVHYEALEAKDRILMPDLPALENLRHRWFWKRRNRPYVPVWSYAKIPRATFSPEENARLLSVYMRPWTLNPADETKNTPLLSNMGLQRSSDSSPNANDGASPTPAASKRRRLTQKRPEEARTENAPKRSYAATWQTYIDGNVVSESNRKYITNILMATAARVVENRDDSSEDSDAFEYIHGDRKVGNMDLIHQTLHGIRNHSAEDGAEGLGRHAQTIRLGRDLWQSAPLTEEQQAIFIDILYIQSALWH